MNVYDYVSMGILAVAVIIAIIMYKNKKANDVLPSNFLSHNTNMKSDKTMPKTPKIKEHEEIPSVEEGSVVEKKKWFNLGRWDKRKLKKHPSKSFLIRMLFSNGTSKEFVIKTNKELFKYRKRWYHLRYENSYFNLTQNQYELTYFDDFVEPLDREVMKQGNKAFYNVTPENVKPIIDMNYVKVLASSQEIDKWLKMCAILSGIILVVFLYVAYQLSEILTRVA